MFWFQEEVADFYNATECCVSAGMSELCMTLCSYEARTRDFQTLSVACSPYFHTLLRCAAGGRDHLVRLQNLRRRPLARHPPQSSPSAPISQPKALKWQLINRSNYRIIGTRTNHPLSECAVGALHRAILLLTRARYRYERERCAVSISVTLSHSICLWVRARHFDTLSA